MTKRPEQIYHPIFVSSKECFLCGDKDNITEEHIFPRWLIKKYNLYDQTIQIINGTDIKYPQLTIPCCAECNDKYLGNNEQKIREAIFSKEIDRVIELGDKLLCQWLAKMSYGILRKELDLDFSIKDKSQGKMLNEKELEDKESLHRFIQSVFLNINFDNFFPHSLFIFELHEINEKLLSFDFNDFPDINLASIRMDNIGIIVCYFDEGFIKNEMNHLVTKFEKRKITPFQFEELKAIVMTLSSLLNNTKTYLSTRRMDDTKINVSELPTTYPTYFSEWNPDMFISFFEMFMEKWEKVLRFERPLLNSKTGLIQSFIGKRDAPIIVSDKEWDDSIKARGVMNIFRQKRLSR